MSGQSHTENGLDSVAKSLTDDNDFEDVDFPDIPHDPGIPTHTPLVYSECRIDRIRHVHRDGDGSGRVSTVRSIFRRKKEDTIQIKNETDRTICIVCTQDLVSVLDNGGAGLNAGAAGVDLRLDIAKALVGVKEIKSVLKLGPNEIAGRIGGLQVYNSVRV